MTTKKFSLQIPRTVKSGAFVRLDSRNTGTVKYTITVDAAKRLKNSEVLVRQLSHTEKVAIANAEQQLRNIVSSKISAAQRLKAQELADKAKLARDSDITAKFRRIPHAA